MALRADVERVREVLEASDVATNGTHGVAVFACGPADVLEVVRLAHPIESRAVVDGHAYVEPLVGGPGGDRWCVLLVNRRVARIFDGTAEGLAESGRMASDTHGQHDQGGWSQARYQRSVEQEKRTHVDGTLDTLFALFKRSPFDRLAVGAPEELVGEVEERLHPYLKERLAGRVGVDVENSSVGRGPGAAAATVIDRHVAERRAEALDRWRRASAAATAASRPARGARRARAGAGRDPARRRGLRRAGARRGARAGDHPVRRGDRGAPLRRPRRPRRDRRRASLLAWPPRSSSSTSRTTSPPAGRSPLPTATRSPGGSTRSPAPASSTSSSRHATGIRRTTGRSPHRAARGRSTASRARRREFHPALDRSLLDAVVDTGYTPELEGYSGFEATTLEALLREHHVDHVTIVGLATDYCVKQTALDALRRGFGVDRRLDRGAAGRGRAGDGERALEQIRAAGGPVA